MPTTEEHFREMVAFYDRLRGRPGGAAIADDDYSREEIVTNEDDKPSYALFSKLLFIVKVVYFTFTYSLILYGVETVFRVLDANGLWPTFFVQVSAQEVHNSGRVRERENYEQGIEVLVGKGAGFLDPSYVFKPGKPKSGIHRVAICRCIRPLSSVPRIRLGGLHSSKMVPSSSARITVRTLSVEEKQE